MGDSRAFRPFRPSIQAPSPHSYPSRVHTIDPVRGGSSKRKAKGSVLVNSSPVARDRTSYLYTSSPPTPGRKISHIPDSPRLRIGCTRPSQWLKLHTTETRSALGAHTAKVVPGTPPTTPAWLPSFLYSSRWLPSARRWMSKSERTRPKAYGSCWVQRYPSRVTNSRRYGKICR